MGGNIIICIHLVDNVVACSASPLERGTPIGGGYVKTEHIHFLLVPTAWAETVIVWKWRAARPIPVTEYVCLRGWRGRIPWGIAKRREESSCTCFKRCQQPILYHEGYNSHFGRVITGFVLFIHRHMILTAAPTSNRLLLQKEKAWGYVLMSVSIRYRQTPCRKRGLWNISHAWRYA